MVAETGGENWWRKLVAKTGGSPNLGDMFDFAKSNDICPYSGVEKRWFS